MVARRKVTVVVVVGGLALLGLLMLWVQPSADNKAHEHQLQGQEPQGAQGGGLRSLLPHPRSVPQVEVVKAEDVVGMMNKVVGDVNKRFDLLQKEIDTLAERQEVLIKANADVTQVQRGQQQQQQHAQGGHALVDGQPQSPHEQQQQQQQQQQQEVGEVGEGDERDRRNEETRDLDALRKRAETMNKDQTVQNHATCKNTLARADDDLIVFVVMVHKRVDYLENFLESLRAVRYIEDAVLVVSQDFFSAEHDRVLNGIDFMCVIRIFYPGSLQLNPDRFPGTDPNDCPRDVSKAEAQRLRCNNAEHPDQYNHYREAQYTIIKHHWWWKLNFVFDKMPVLQHHDGLKVLLEEDHYVAPDAIHMLLKTWRAAKDSGHVTDVVVLGDYEARKTTFVGDVIHRMPWVSTRHNMGMAFGRALFDKLKACARMFCEYDDYNWDWSLFALSARGCLDSGPLHALVMAGQRVQHLGVCGVHTTGKDCSGSQALQRAKIFNEQHADAMFPSAVRIESRHGQTPFARKGFGGWGDPRDIELCLSFVQN